MVTGPNSKLKTLDDLVGKTIGISRFGSGSHLMSFVLADEKGWIGDKEKLFKFSVQHDFTQLRNSVQTGKKLKLKKN